MQGRTIFVLTERNPKENGHGVAEQHAIHQCEDAAGASGARHDRQGRHRGARHLPGRRHQRTTGDQRCHPRCYH